MRCARCTAEMGDATRFCTRCGEPLQLVHCPECDVANAASRRFCGRCGTALRGEASPAAPPAGGPVPSGPGVPAALLVVTVLAALAIIGVVLTILSARGVWLFAGPGEPEAPEEPVAAEVVRVTASSEVPPSGDVVYGATNLVDGDESTAWKEGVAGDGEGEWVELTLPAEVALVRLLVWNGYQQPGRFDEHNRVARARIEVGERSFTADLLDVEGPQAIDLPEAVVADRVRLTILGVHTGLRYEDTAVSRLEVYASPDAG
jgi:hypothetical protein